MRDTFLADEVAHHRFFCARLVHFFGKSAKRSQGRDRAGWVLTHSGSEYRGRGGQGGMGGVSDWRERSER